MAIIIKKVIPLFLFSALQPAYHFLLAFFSTLWYGFPSRNLVVIGVTGTKGKTSVVELLHAVFSEAGYATASQSSYAFRIKDSETKNDKKMTMPGRFFVQKFLRDAKKAKCRFVILEVTSEGIRQYRHRFINFHAAVVTNIAPEHIESHGGFEPYVRAKLDLFMRLPHDGFAVINADDNECPRFLAATSAKKVFYGKEKVEFSGKKTLVKDIEAGEKGIEFSIDGKAVTSPLKGEFNAYNLLAAYTAAAVFHVSPEKIISAFEKFKGVPGRMEYVLHDPFHVVVDYAHTPDSLKSVYSFLNSQKKGKMICVLGSAGGGRDKWKRPEFGKIAGEFCDEIILTNEDSYDEDSQKILEEIAAGLPATRIMKYKNILDRRGAIHDALMLAKPGDTVVITGKGSEPWIMGSNGAKTPWDDREAVREESQKIDVKK
ncbi:MAG: UDP-N-acetylmuramoyl-L-alanyl-D-glutamate--2,6-diaminopimelate ligase [Candidatus Sungbacteria bacterium]|nr:UDP-N-acetylmuramoyl-L-alanyl-D-glutamate--2,6-diaminopimelate ligase [Candidatus Sungbacteria bacterium]